MANLDLELDEDTIMAGDSCALHGGALADCHQCEEITDMTLVELLSAWNDATSPFAPRTDSEHEFQNDLARKLDAETKSRYIYGRDWKELSNGMRWPIAKTEVSR